MYIYIFFTYFQIFLAPLWNSTKVLLFPKSSSFLKSMSWVVWMRHSIVFARCCACMCSAFGCRHSTVYVSVCMRADCFVCRVFSVGENNASFSFTVVDRQAETSPCYPHRYTCTTLFLCAFRQKRPFGNYGAYCV